MQLDENQTSLKVEIADRVYYLVCDKQSPLGELHDVLSSMKNHIIYAIQKANQPQEVNQPPKEKVDGDQ